MSRPRMLEDWQWDKIRPYLPVKVASRKGGRPRAGDRECLEGILMVRQTARSTRRISLSQYVLAAAGRMGRGGSP